MASINGIELKGQKQFLGHEQEPCYQGNLYVEGKKVAFWSQDGHGSIEDNVDMAKGYSESELRKKIVSLNEDKTTQKKSISGEDYTFEYELENLMYDLLCLKDYEKHYNSAVKKGYGAIAVIDGGYETVIFSLPKEYLEMSDEQIKQDKNIQQYLGKIDKHQLSGEEPSVVIFRNPSDFEIGDPIKTSDIKFEKKPIERD